MNKDGSITINDFHKGASISALQGNEAIVNCDVFDEVGVLKPSNSLELIKTVATNKGAVIAISEVPDLGYYKLYITKNGDVMNNYYTGDFFVTTSYTKGYDALPVKIQNTGAGTDLWDGHIFTCISGGVGNIGVVVCPTNPTGISPTLPQSNLATTGFLKLLNGGDGKIYFANGNKIGSFDKDITRDYTTGAITLPNYTSNALDLPKYEAITTIENFNRYIAIGTESGRIYLWDRVSASFQIAIEVNERINAFEYYNNVLYFSAGIRGNLYMSNGSSFAKIASIPYSQRKDYAGNTSYVYPNALTTNGKDGLFLGISSLGGTFTDSAYGVWEIMIVSGYPHHLIYTDRARIANKTAFIDIGAIKVSNLGQVKMGIETNTGSVKVSEIVQLEIYRKANYNSSFYSPLYFVGTRNSRKTFNSVDFQFLRPLESGQGIKISYRKNLSDSFTEIGTWDYATLGAVISHETKALIADAEMVQFKIDLAQSTTGSKLALTRVIIK